MSDYEHHRGIAHGLAFNYWAPHVMKKRDAIIYLVKNRKPQYLKLTHKFGVEFPKSVADAYAIDKKNGNTFWDDRIAKEVKNVQVAFNIVPYGYCIPQNYQFVHCHMIFDVEIEDFHRKARYVAGGHMKNAPPTITYASIAGRETVRIALALAALNGLEVNAGEIENAYVNAPVTEKIRTKLGEEFGDDSGKKAIIVWVFYVLKFSGAAFRNHLAKCMRHI